MRPGVVVAVLVIACQLPPASARAQSEQARQRKARQELQAWNRLVPYLTLVAAYRSGDRDRATAGVTGESDASLKALFENLDVLGDRLCLCRQTDDAIEGRTEAGEIEVVDLDAAVLMHTDAALGFLAHRDRPGLVRQLGAARRLVEWVRIRTMDWSRDPRNPPPGCRPAPEMAAVDWYVAVSQALIGYWEVDAAEAFARRGLELAPEDPTLLVVLGTIAESGDASFSRPSARDVELGRWYDPAVRRGLRAAEDLFTRAVAADPGFVEAHLRLGRVLALLDRPDEARAELERVLERSTDASQCYLAALFLGRVLEDQGNVDEAAASYRRAIAERPECQTARIALAYVLSGRGQSAGALSLLREAIERPWQPYQASDPWWTYSFRPFARGLEALDALRRQVVKP